MWAESIFSTNMYNFQTIFIKLATNQQIAPLAFKPETIWVRPETTSFSLLARNFSLLSFLRITCWLCRFIRWTSHLFLSAASIWPSTIPFFFSSQAELGFKQTFFFYEEIKKKKSSCLVSTFFLFLCSNTIKKEGLQLQLVLPEIKTSQTSQKKVLFLCFS